MAALLPAMACGSAARPATTPRSVDPGSEIRLVADEADAALAIVARRRSGAVIADADWEHVFASEGYRRLAQRETAMGRSFADSAFRAFLLSDTLAGRAPALAAAVDRWKRMDLRAASHRALAYLPAGARIRATMFLTVKPRTNSFVFATEAGPAIFMYVDPRIGDAKLDNTLAHELHHIGYGAACHDAAGSTLPPRLATVVHWMGGFGEGLAMLAAAGGPDVHPHAVSGADERAEWDRSMRSIDVDLRRLESFFVDVLDGRLADPDSVQSAGMSFFGVQGPWYTVGWRMAATIETAGGRERLLRVLCDPRAMLRAYNVDAASRNQSTGARLPLWSDAFLARLAAPH